MKTKTIALTIAMSLLAFAVAVPTVAADGGGGTGADDCPGDEILPWALCMVFSTVDEVCYLTPIC